MAYLDDVPPNGGGFRLWPGSHKRVFHTFERQHTSFRGEAFAEAMAEVAADTVPVDCYGPAGTVRPSSSPPARSGLQAMPLG